MLGHVGNFGRKTSLVSSGRQDRYVASFFFQFPVAIRVASIPR
jgi:hypothetical protein